jgi:subtilisin family serine protease
MIRTSLWPVGASGGGSCRNYLGAAAHPDRHESRRLSVSTEEHYGPASESTVSVAATTRCGTGNPFTGGAANPIQTYSSDGPRRMFYEPNGTAITPGNVLFGTNGGRLLQKPDITAADCVTTTTPGFIPFCGTSAAAPHAGAIAALLLSSSPAPTPALVRATLGATALDIEAAGIDRDSGRGIVMANRAQAAADLAVTMSGPASVAAGANAVYTLTITHNGSARRWW